MTMRKGLICLVATFVLGLLTLFTFNTPVNAADGEFTLQVSPSPMVLVLKPGETSTHELKIRNTGTETEQLRIDPRVFSINENGKVALDDLKVPSEIGDWISFSAQEFTVKAGETYTQKVTFAIPESAGFSYSFSLVVTRQDPPSAATKQRLQGKVAIFCLISIDRSGATRTIELQELKTDQGIYEYLPAMINVTLKNSGNTIVRPVGNIFIQRGSDDSTPITTLPVNSGDGYILPDSIRTLSANWSDGFQVVKTATDAAGNIQKNVEWNWSQLSSIRVGKYTAKVVVLYNDGQRDVPVVGEVSFWVIPWKLLLGALVVLVILGFGVWSVVSKLFTRVKKNNVSFSNNRRIKK